MKEMNNYEKFCTTFDGRRVFVFGNGFDMALGRKITFADFFKSSYWPNENQSSPLRKFIEMWGATDCWFDLERYMDMFSNKQNCYVPRNQNEDRKFFDALTTNLTNYIKTKEIPKEQLDTFTNTIKERSIAYKLFEDILWSGDFSLFSFNYTNLKPLTDCFFKDHKHYLTGYNIQSAEQLYERFMQGFEYVHGELGGKGIIVGGRNKDTDTVYKFLNKEMCIQYTQVIEKLQNAEEVIIYGHSLSGVDFDYFKNFFDSLLSNDSKCKKVHIFTYDNDSMHQIKERLNNENKELAKLWSRSKVEFHPTKDMTPDAADKIVKRIFPRQ